MRRCHGFTLVELVLSISILVLLLLVAVPSVNGVLGDRRLRRSLDGFNQLVAQAQKLSVEERRPYLLVWEEGRVTLRPEAFAKDEEEKPTAVLSALRGEVYTLKLPAALSDEPAPEWIFWPAGICEPAIISFKGSDGVWSAEFAALTGRSSLVIYEPR